jgi:LysM repeat protein
MKSSNPTWRWLVLFLALLLVTVTACVRKKPSPTPIPTVTPVPTTEAATVPTATAMAIQPTTPAGTESGASAGSTTAPEQTPVVTETVETRPQPTAVPTAPPAAAGAPSGEATSYTVQPGDTLYSIARRFNTTPEALAQLNNLVNPDILVVGQILAIPGAGGVTQPSGTQGGTVYTVQVGDTMFSIAQRFHTTVEAIAQANDIYNPWFIYVGQRLVIPVAGGEGTPQSAVPPSAGQKTYTVQPGDTLYSIALRFDTTVQALIALNNLSSLGLIYPGQILQLP